MMKIHVNLKVLLSYESLEMEKKRTINSFKIFRIQLLHNAPIHQDNYSTPLYSISFLIPMLFPIE